MELITKDHPLLQIAQIVSGNDKKVIEQITECITDTEAYFNSHFEQYEDRDFVEFEEEEPEYMSWIGVVDILEENNYICERDWKDAKEDFIYFFNNLSTTKKLLLEIDEDLLDEDGDISQWCSILDEEWEEKEICISAFDIDSDSYVIFPCKINDFEKLQELAVQIEQRIDLAKNM